MELSAQVVPPSKRDSRRCLEVARSGTDEVGQRRDPRRARPRRHPMCDRGGARGTTKLDTPTARTNMNRRQVLNIGGAGLALSLGVGAVAEEPKMPYVRIAELEIDPAQLDDYKASVKEEMA